MFKAIHKLSFFEVLLEDIRSLGGSDNDLYRILEPENKLLILRFAEMIMGKHVPFEQYPSSWDITVDYSININDMIDNGNYDYVHKNIDSSYFFYDTSGISELEIHIIHLNGGYHINQVVQTLSEHNWRPINFLELLCLGIQYPDLQRQFSIIALDASWFDNSGICYMPYLSVNEHGRCLSLQKDNSGTWHKHYWIAVVASYS